MVCRKEFLNKKEDGINTQKREKISVKRFKVKSERIEKSERVVDDMKDLGNSLISRSGDYIGGEIR